MKDYIALCKPRIAFLSMITAGMGYTLSGTPCGPRFFWTLLGVGFAAAASGCLNQFLERAADALMRRTAGRPLPAGRLSPRNALIWGLLLAAAGPLILFLRTGALAGELTAASIAVYVLLYTPLKKVTPHTTWIGAAAGAAPPLIGWAAARGALSPLAFVPFAIQYLWQIPHFLSLFWIYRAEYARAGFKVMPVLDDSGRLTAAQIAVHSFTVLLMSLLPSLCGMAGLWYAAGALLLGTIYLGVGLKASWTMEVLDARRLFLASLAYLPLLFGMLWVGA